MGIPSNGMGTNATAGAISIPVGNIGTGTGLGTGTLGGIGRGIAGIAEGIATGVTSVGALTLAAILTPTMAHCPTRSIPLDVPKEKVKDGPEETITLYRGVSSKIFNEDGRKVYFYAHFGTAIPKGYFQVNTRFGPHRDMENHAAGDNYSVWTSWSSSKETARDFATGIAFGEAVPGIIMSKKFKIGKQATPNPFNPSEGEWLVPGVVYGAKVEYVVPRSK